MEVIFKSNEIKLEQENSVENVIVYVKVILSSLLGILSNLSPFFLLCSFKAKKITIHQLPTHVFLAFFFLIIFAVSFRASLTVKYFEGKSFKWDRKDLNELIESIASGLSLFTIIIGFEIFLSYKNKSKKGYILMILLVILHLSIIGILGTLYYMLNINTIASILLSVFLVIRSISPLKSILIASQTDDIKMIPIWSSITSFLNDIYFLVISINSYTVGNTQISNLISIIGNSCSITISFFIMVYYWYLNKKVSHVQTFTFKNINSKNRCSLNDYDDYSNMEMN